jgi:hypothetical protein
MTDIERAVSEHEKKYHTVNNSSWFYYASTGRNCGKTAFQEMFIDGIKEAWKPIHTPKWAFENEPKKAWKPKAGEDCQWDGVSGCKDSHYKDRKPQRVTIKKSFTTIQLFDVYDILVAGEIISVNASHLSPLPEPKPEHYDGEPCSNPIFSDDIEAAKAFRFEHTGEFGDPCNKWAVNGSGNIMFFNNYSGGLRWILRSIPIDPDQTRLNEIQHAIIELSKETIEIMERMKK